MVLVIAPLAMPRQLATGHGNERTTGSVDNFEITNDETVVDGDGTESPKSVFGVLHQFDANLGDFHSPTLPNRRTRRTKRAAHLQALGCYVIVTGAGTAMPRVAMTIAPGSNIARA